MGDASKINIPPGFEFSPSDEELVLHFLFHKATNSPHPYPNIIPDLHDSHDNPWDLNGLTPDNMGHDPRHNTNLRKAMSNGKQWYFYSRMRENRVTRNGFWKQLHEEPIFTTDGYKVGTKKYLVFYINNGDEANLDSTETNWVMIEYGLISNSEHTRRNTKSDYSKWVVCRVYEKSDDEDDDHGSDLSSLDEMLFSILDDEVHEI